MHDNDLRRFLDAQNQAYLKALSEIKNGQKRSHWMWYIFPQLRGLGYSETAQFYGIKDLSEATAYLAHPVLGKHLIEIASAVLHIKGKTAIEIFGSPDDLKLHSSMSLFSRVDDADLVFQQVLDAYFDSKPDENTLRLLG